MAVFRVVAPYSLVEVYRCPMFQRSLLPAPSRQSVCYARNQYEIQEPVSLGRILTTSRGIRSRLSTGLQTNRGCCIPQFGPKWKGQARVRLKGSSPYSEPLKVQQVDQWTQGSANGHDQDSKEIYGETMGKITYQKEQIRN